jgi:hypothetical protein
MSTAVLPRGFSTLSNLAGVFVEEIAAADERVTHDARPDVGGDDQLHFAIGHAIAIRPASIIYFLDFGCWLFHR